MLTNFKTIRKSINRLQELKQMQEDGVFEVLPKKEVSKLMLDGKTRKNLGGIVGMKQHPVALFIDPRRNEMLF